MEIKKIKIKTWPKIFVIFQAVGKGQTHNFFLALCTYPIHVSTRLFIVTYLDTENYDL